MLIKVHNQSGKYSEWCMLEFQGEMVGELEGKELGILELRSENRAEMEIGQHFLEGDVIVLKSPMLVIDNDAAEDETSENTTRNYSINAIVKRKIIFKTRPKPIGLKRLRP